jgi:hypothetical protein
LFGFIRTDPNVYKCTKLPSTIFQFFDTITTAYIHTSFRQKNLLLFDQFI